jgi:hypothetical protein
VNDAIGQARRLGAILPLIPTPVLAPCTGLLLGGHRPQFMACASDTVELTVTAQVDRDEINNERLVVTRGSEINGVEIIRVGSPPTPLVPLPDIFELRTQGNEHFVRRCRLARCHMTAIHQDV